MSEKSKRKITLTSTLNEAGEKELITISFEGGEHNHKVWFEGIRKRLKVRKRGDPFPLTMDDVHLMMHKPDLMKTQRDGYYQLVSDFSEVISSGTVGNYLRYEEAPMDKVNIYKTR